MRFRAKASTFGATRKSTQANGLTIKCMDTDILSGLMASNIRVNSRKISVMVKVDSFGRMAASTKAAGIEESSLELATISTSTESKEKVFGSMEDANAGSMTMRRNETIILKNSRSTLSRH